MARVQGVTGVVVTVNYGVTKILKPVKVGYKKSGTSPELSLIAGDTIYTLHYLGEGYDLFWYRGQTYSDQIAVPEDSIGHAPYSDIVMAESRPKYEWWVKVKDSHGQMGWTDEATSFAHMDACE